MASQRTLFTASRLQTLTYLLAVCPFSIAFLVFINSSISFVVTDLIGLHEGEGDVVGTLGFADELLALAACPIWGVLSDRVGVRHVCVAGYAIVALALVVFVQAKNIYPQLLLGRLLFSVGGSAVSTMVTAVLPVVTGSTSGPQEYQRSLSSDSTLTSDQPTSPDAANEPKTVTGSSSRLAGFVGTCAGCGALVSLVLFLPLPERFQKSGLSPPEAIRSSYYVVAAVAVSISICCLFGLRDLPGEEGKGWKSFLSTFRHQSPENRQSQRFQDDSLSPLSYWRQLRTAVALGVQNQEILLGYVGGFVARASSVGISLFIPLFVNHYYRATGLCNNDPPKEISASDMSDIKKSCSEAYILASILTGVSQLVALLAAPAFGFLSEKSRRYHLPLLTSALSGIVGYLAFALVPNPQFKGPDGSAGVFVLMALIGISQIGAIVCSLAVLSNGILKINAGEKPPGEHYGQDRDDQPVDEADRNSNEDQPLLEGSGNQNMQQQYSQLKGSIAGVYSLYGGAGILLLTKLGGYLFDTLDSGSPFYLMAAFNVVLFATGIICGLVNKARSTQPQVAP
ncbi:putative MFS transporter [Aspergillus glaucus CBS 516.65]|uniref:Major facilitator superfamily (MFS) profile domain-containing protein n=1 Tax=Aspergillus glaucus CBS 516.65 TaxID=1160497 RepID=A0A1L9VY49_ASPGL|nr:hypothetical protein ASPGLDRAFT_117078 [Aspergillus glaucus CBS 516.65]OJJ88797.1 hypothetical protein ASPGLDRAFT_117078 [Aspergillus glaucus CBS 516.65]